MMTKDNYKRLASIFMPRALHEYNRVKSETGPDFVHYTSAENFLNIFKVGKPSIWMRNARCMNDTSEIEHGLQRIDDVFAKEDRLQRFTEALDLCHDRLGSDATGVFNLNLKSVVDDTYITCVSEHDAWKENDIGRLSMWRAYGQGSIGIAIILSKAPFLSETNYLNAFCSPVSYIDDEELGYDIEAIIDNINNNRDFISSESVGDVLQAVTAMLTFGAICLKHRGFKEEKEWRIICSSSLGKPILKSSTVTVSGVPQKIYNIGFEDYSGLEGAFDISPNSIVKRVIIGPSNYPSVIRDGVVDTLNKVGVKDAHDRVVISDIPLRTLI